MSEEQKHSAVGSMAGMTYQIYCYFKQLLLLKPGESASLELYDDVALASGETIKYFQLKHSVTSDKRMTKRDHDLWKTLAMWVNIIQSKGNEEEQLQWLSESEYILLTNKNTEDNDFVTLLNKYKKDVTDTFVWKELSEFIDEQASKNTPSEDGKLNDVDKFAKTLKEYKYKRELLQRIIVEEQTDEDILKEIDNVLQFSKYVSKASVPSLRNALLGSLMSSFVNSIQKGLPSVYSAESFNQKYGPIISGCRERNFVRLREPLEIPENIDDLTFIRQLEDIQDNKVKESKNRLVTEFLSFSNDYNLSKSSLTEDDIMDFEKDVHARWDNLYDEIYGENEDLSEIDVLCSARELLRSTRKEQVVFNGEYIGSPSSNGCYYYFSNGDHPTIGWRKDWKERYNGKKWTEIYG